MRKLLKATAASVALLGLTGCATGFPAQVSRFQAMPAPAGETFAVIPMNEADAGGLEFSRYAEMVAAELREEGYVQAADPASATMLVELGYGVDDGRERIVGNYPGYHDPRFRFGIGFGRYYHPWYGYRYARHPYFGRRLAYSWGWDDPFWAGPGVRSYTEYRSTVEVDIRRAADNQAIFEGTAKARSRTDEMGALVPNLIEAMFTDFPGRNGETVRITVKPEDERR